MPARSNVQLTCAWLREAEDELSALSRLACGWDSHGAAAPEPALIAAARGFLFRLCGTCELPKPYMCATPSGGVQLEWETDSRYFEVEFLSEHAAACLYQDIAGGIDEEFEIGEAKLSDDALLHRIAEYVHRVFAE